MKKLFSLLLLLMGTMTAWAEELTVVEVTTWGGIQNYLKDADKGSKVCRLMNDIDFNGGTIESLDKGLNINYENPLSGFTIDGNGHTIKNGVINEHTLLNYVQNCTIKNLKFDNVRASFTEGFLVYLAKSDSHFENLSFNNCEIKTNSTYGIGFVCSYVYDNSTNLSFSDITVTNCYISSNWYGGSIAGVARNSTLTNCHVSNTNLYGNKSVGGIIGKAINSTLTDCSFQGKVSASYTVDSEINAGGIAGEITGTNSKISNCQNFGEVEAGANRAGGIVGSAWYATIERCKNTGWIHHKKLTGSNDKIGGISGYGKDANISKCINAGSIDGGNEHAGGIVGYLEGNSSITHCVNGGFVNGKEYVGGIAGQIEDNSTVSFCIGASNRIEGGECTQLLVGAEPKGSTSNNYWISETSNIYNGAVTKADLKSGKVAYYINYKAGVANDNYIWGQALTNQGEGIEDYPTPGGQRVYEHITDCKNQERTFYNNCALNHYGDIVQYSAGEYYCFYCGNEVTDGADYVTGFTICNAQDLADFVASVNAGHPFVKAHVYDDIDCTSLSTFTPIGSQTNAYCGTFDGHGHRIKNLHLSGSQNGLGLFGALGNGATVSNIILDASCSVTGDANSTNQAGIAGIAGCVYASPEQTTVNVYLENCGNEANISGFSNAGGILGGVYGNDNIHVYMTRCYNTGAISATETSAALAGWLYKYFDIKDCWNSGTVTHSGSNYDKLVYRRADNANLNNVSNTYSTIAQDGIFDITAADIITGRLCYLLNGSKNYGDDLEWGQVLESDKYPTFSSEGITYKRTMANEWGTVVLPFDVEYDPDNENYKLYYLTAADGNKLTFTEYDYGIIYQGTPMAVKKLSGNEIEIAPVYYSDFETTIIEQNSSNASLPSGWTMTGTYNNLTNQTGIYYIAQNQFWWAESPITIAPFRAWFTGPATTQNAALRIVVSDGSETSTIGEITADGNVNFYDAPIYTIQGQRQQTGQKGLQIRNGKVILINK